MKISVSKNLINATESISHFDSDEKYISNLTKREFAKPKYKNI